MDILTLLLPFSVPLGVVFGLLVGSFLNVVIHRLPLMMERAWTDFARSHLKLPEANDTPQPYNLLKPDSHCPQCRSPIKAWQNIPLVSYLLLGGKCRSCRRPIGKRYPLVELLTGAAFGIIVWQYGLTLAALGGCILSAFLIALAFIDADTQYLPDDLTLPLLWLGLIFNLNGTFTPLQTAVAGAAAGYCALWLLSYAYYLAKGRPGMGHGDFKLFAALGAWLGIGILPVLVFAASLIGITGALVCRIGKNQAFAFGPALAAAGWLILAAHPQVLRLIDWWLHQSGF